MCGFIQRVTDNPAVIDLLIQVGLDSLVPHFSSQTPEQLNFYPAFGGDTSRQIKSLIIQPPNQTSQVIDATWWFDCSANETGLKVGERTTFNARNLESSFWKGALHHHRAIVIATAIGESNNVGNRRHHYLIESQQAFLLGALYRPFSNGQYCTAVITRPPHPRFADYHSKSTPMFLPANKELIQHWLSDDYLEPSIIDILNNQRIYNDLKVTQVKTFKRAEPLALSEWLDKDL